MWKWNWDSAGHKSYCRIIHSQALSCGGPKRPQEWPVTSPDRPLCVASQSIQFKEISRLAIRYQLLLTLTLTAHTQVCKHTHTYVFPDTFMECQSPALKSLVSLLPKLLLPYWLSALKTSAVTLPNWEIIRFSIMGLMNAHHQGSWLSLHSCTGDALPFLTPAGFSPEKDKLLVSNILSQDHPSILARGVWAASTQAYAWG